MNQIFQLEPSLFVCGQIGPDDLEQIRCLGIKTIVCNRPDEEVNEPIQSARIALAAAQAELSFVYLPVHGHELDEPGAPALHEELGPDLQAPVLLYCRTGRRSTLLWARDAVSRIGIQEVSRRAVLAGVDREELLLVLENVAEPEAA